MSAAARGIFAVALALAAAAANAATLSASPASVPFGGSSTVTAAWSAIASPSSTDWIGLYTPGAPDQGSLAWRYTTGAASGSVPFTIPAGLAPGSYQLRLFWNNGYTLLAVSNGVTVGATVSGTVTRNGSPLAGVAFAGTNNATCTSSNTSGAYTCTVPPGWSGSVTPTLAAHSFTPGSRSYTNLTASQAAQDYTAVLNPKISGTVTLFGAPLAGVSFSGTNGAVCNASNAAGQYSCEVPPGWSGEITPSMGGYSFTPASRPYTNVTADQAAQDYPALTYQVSGTITSGTLPLGGVVLTPTTGASCTASNASGQYACAVPAGWTGTITPSLTGYTFTPPHRNYTSISANQVTQDFSATLTAAATPIFFIHVDHLNTPRLVATGQAGGMALDEQEPLGVDVPKNPLRLTSGGCWRGSGARPGCR